MKVEKAKKREIKFTNSMFSVSTLLYDMKSLLEDKGYTFVEKEQSVKDGKYGREIVFKVEGEKEIDEFAKTQIMFDCEFENLKKIKLNNVVLDKGDLFIVIKGGTVYDYKNKWGKNSFSKFLFGLYMRYFYGKKAKEKYIDKLDDETLTMYNYLLEKIEFPV